MLAELCRRLVMLLRRGRFDADLDEEMRLHCELREHELVEGGLSQKEAHYAAQRRFGNDLLLREESRDMWGWNWLENLLQDVRYGLRMLAKNPAFTAVAVLTLALGIGANTAIFSLVNGVLLRPLAYHDPGQLYVLREIFPPLAHLYPTFPVNAQHFLEWRKECHSFADMAALESTSFNLTGVGEPERIKAARVSANFFTMLGIEPRLGRTFVPEEDQAGHDHVVVLTDRLWRRRFQGDPSILGKALTLDDVPYQIVGVLPASFHFFRGNELGLLTEFAEHTELFKPIGFSGGELQAFGEFDFGAIARLAPGVGAAEALAELSVVQERIVKSVAKEIPQISGASLKATMWPLQDQVVGSARRPLIMLLVAVGAVLLIVCVNLANLTLTRATGRSHEGAVRVALGASRWRLGRQVLTETLLLSFFGGGVGVCLAYWGLKLLVARAPFNLPRLDEVTVDARVLWFSILVSLATGVLFGLLPSLRLATADPGEALKTGGRTASENKGSIRLRGLLVGVEVGLSAALLILAGLLVKSLVRVLKQDIGLLTNRILAVNLALPSDRYGHDEDRVRFYDQLLSKVRTLPGIRLAGLIDTLPFTGERHVSDISVEGSLLLENERIANYRYVSPEYFRVMGIPLVKGRIFEERDRNHYVAILTQQAAARIWPSEDPIGKTFETGQIQENGKQCRIEVIGIVGDFRSLSLEKAPVFMVYMPYWSRSPDGAWLVVRTTIDPRTVAASARRAVWSADGSVPVSDLRTMGSVVEDSVGPRRFETLLAVLFAASALLLASLGIYGVVSYSVERRQNEIGIRRAFGAQEGRVLRLVMQQELVPVGCGLLAGFVLALAFGRVVRALLFEVGPGDPLVSASALSLLAAVAALSCYIPARRATKVDPMVALRYE